MKSKAFRICIPILCAAVLFAGCASARTSVSGQNGDAAQTEEQTVTVTETQPADEGTAAAEPEET